MVHFSGSFDECKILRENDRKKVKAQKFKLKKKEAEPETFRRAH